MSKQLELDKVAHEIEECLICLIGKSGRAVVGEGNADAHIVFVGEAPGKQEAKTGKPFIGRSGQLLRKMIQEIGLDDENDVYITSPVKYLPDRGTPTSADITHGREHLAEQLKIINPKIVVLMGSVAAQGVLEEKIPVKSRHGEVIEKDGKKYFITLHPAAALRFQPLKLIIQEDFQKLKTLL